MSNLQLPFDNLSNPDCTCKELVDPEDIACYSLGGGHGKYQFFDEHSPQVAQALADCAGLSFDTVTPKPLRGLPRLPDFIPVVPRGSGKLFEGFTPPFVAVSIGDAITPSLKVHGNIRKRMGIPAASKLILLCYEHDGLIENIWPRHREVFEQLREAGIDLIAPINYSVWHSQPHIERLINLKRSLVVYETLQDLGFETIPHLYWYGKTDLRRWAAWLNAHPCVTMVAIDLQTIGSREKALWQPSMSELAEFTAQLERPLFYLVSGPSTPDRITDVVRVLGPRVSFTNTTAAIKAWNRLQITNTPVGLHSAQLLGTPKSELFEANHLAFTQLIRDIKQRQLIETLSRNLKTSELRRLSPLESGSRTPTITELMARRRNRRHHLSGR